MKYSNLMCFLILVGFGLMLNCKAKDKIITSDDLYINVTDYGISNNTSRDQTKAIQKLFIANRKNGKFFFPKGEYHVSSLNIYEGIEILGEEDTWFVKIKNCTKFSRMFNTIEYLYSDESDSKTIKFSKINIDGNFENQGDYSKYQLEHQAMIFLMGDRTKKGRLKVEIDSCAFTNGVADAISVYCNVDARITNCEVTDVFRGGITVTGGYSKVYANNINIGGNIHKSGIDVEVDGRGYNKTYAVELDYSDMILEGDFDVSIKDGGIGKFDNINVNNYPYNFHAPGGTILVSNSNFVSSALSSAKLYYPHNIQFDNCTFRIVDSQKEGDLGAFLVYWNTSYRKSKDLILKFKECKFINEVLDPNRIIKGLTILPDDYSQHNVLHMENCEFTGNFDYNIFMKQGGSVELKNIQFDGRKGLYLNSVVNKSNYRYNASLDNVTMKDQSDRTVIYNEHNSNQISLKNTPFSKSNSIGKKRFGNTKIVKVQ